MARRLGKRKQPDRDDFMLHEQFKVEDGMFDTRSVMFIGKLFTRNVISKINFMIARGKEADLYLANPGTKIEKEQVIVKIFRIETSSFGNRMNYLIGDPRFEGIRGNMRSIVYTWCKKEFGNLKEAKEAGAHVPTPYSFIGNVLAMEFIGTDTVPAPILRDVVLGNPEDVFKIIKKDMKKLYDNELVHADISEYNILIKDGVPYIIDFGQAVNIGHPSAASFLERDVYNISKYFFKKYRIKPNEEKMLKYITGKISE